jgi:hypothetical protein
MLTSLPIRIPDATKLSGTPEEQVRQLSAHVEQLKLAINEWVASLNKPGGLSVVQSDIWTPTVTASSGTFTTVSASGSYHKVGDSVYLYEIEVVITTAGTAAGSIVVTLPFTQSTNSMGYGADVTSSFKGVSVTGGAGSNTLNILGVDALTIIGDGVTVRCFGMFIVND